VFLSINTRHRCFLYLASPKRPSAADDSVSSARMGAPPRQPRLSREQRRALALLASIPYGVTRDRLAFAHGFDRATN
jgi:hypothetical protein